MVKAQVDLTRPHDAAALMTRIGQAWTTLENLVAGASEAQLTAQSKDGGWSVKDHLAHISAWEGRLLAFLDGRTWADYWELPQSENLALDTDGLNAIIGDRVRGRTPQEVIANWPATHQRVVVRLQALSDADLKAPYIDPDDPSEREPLLGSGVLDGNTYEHYEEHAVGIRQLLGQR